MQYDVMNAENEVREELDEDHDVTGRVAACEAAELSSNHSAGEMKRTGGLARQRDGSQWEYKQKVFLTVIFYLQLFTLGIGHGIIGPTLLDLQMSAHTDTPSIAYIFIGRFVGGVAGACLAGVVQNRVNRWLMNGLSQMFEAATLLALPWIPNVIALVFGFCLLFFWSVLSDTAGNLNVVWVWGPENGPWLQGLHTVFILGALAAPLIAGPFLSVSPLDGSSEATVSSSDPPITYDDLGITTALTAAGPNSWSELNPTNCSGTTEVWKAYTITAGLVFASFLSFIAFYLCTVPDTLNSSDDECPQNAGTPQSETKFRVSMLMMLLLFFIFYSTWETTYSSYLFSYTVDYLQWNKEEAVLINSAFWFALTAGRAMGILIIRCIPPPLIIGIPCVVMAASLVLLTIFVQSSSHVLWLCTVCMALVAGPVSGAGLTWTETYIKITPIIGSVFMIANTVGNSFGPVLMGSLTRVYTFAVFPYMMCADGVLLLLSFLIMQTVASKHGRRGPEGTEDEEKRKLLDEGSTTTI